MERADDALPSPLENLYDSRYGATAARARLDAGNDVVPVHGGREVGRGDEEVAAARVRTDESVSRAGQRDDAGAQVETPREREPVALHPIDLAGSLQTRQQSLEAPVLAGRNASRTRDLLALERPARRCGQDLQHLGFPGLGASPAATHRAPRPTGTLRVAVHPKPRSPPRLRAKPMLAGVVTPRALK